MVNSVFSIRAAAALILMSAFALTSCGVAASPAKTLLPAAEAAPRYQQLSTDISEVLNAEYPELKLAPVDGRETSMRENNDAECILSIGTLRSQKYLSGLAGGWKPVMETIAPVLKDAGFAPITKTEPMKGGWTGISSQDVHGGEIRIRAKGFTDISVSAKVTDEDCTMNLRG